MVMVQLIKDKCLKSIIWQSCGTYLASLSARTMDTEWVPARSVPRQAQNIIPEAIMFLEYGYLSFIVLKETHFLILFHRN